VAHAASSLSSAVCRTETFAKETRWMTGVRLLQWGKEQTPRPLARRNMATFWMRHSVFNNCLKYIFIDRQSTGMCLSFSHSPNVVVAEVQGLTSRRRHWQWPHSPSKNAWPLKVAGKIFNAIKTIRWPDCTPGQCSKWSHHLHGLFLGPIPRHRVQVHLRFTSHVPRAQLPPTRP